MAIKKKGRAGMSLGDSPVMFKHTDAQRIANVVHHYESSRRPRNPSTLPRSPGSSGGGGDGGGVRQATFSGGWPKHAKKQVVFASDTLSTASATNFLRSIPASSGYRVCYVAQSEVDSGEYVLINAEP